MSRSRLFVIAGGVLFMASLLYFAIAYATTFGELAAWTSAPDIWMPILIDVFLFTCFALHHSVFARTRFRALVERLAPPGTERAIYVWIASLLFLGVSAAWLPVPGVFWRFTGAAGAVFVAIQLFGLALIAVAVRRLGVLTLAGLREPDPAAPLADDGAYGLVRHPIYLGWFLLVWATPLMNGTRLVFAAVSCAYVLVAVIFEERDLRRTFGAAYDRYSQRVKSRVIPGVY